jgi:hypothetical protein
MTISMETFWQKKLESCGETLSKNNFDVFIADNHHHARTIFFKDIFPGIEVKTVSWGDSITFLSTGILDKLRENKKISVIETFADNISREEIIERRRQALLVDLFFTGSNAVTESGQLVNLDMVGNRVGALTFGPKHVVLFIGRNKIVSGLAQAKERIKTIAAPANAIRHTGFKTPCIKTARCFDCNSPDRICNTWMITEKSFPKNRIKIILLNEDNGL